MSDNFNELNEFARQVARELSKIDQYTWSLQEDPHREASAVLETEECAATAGVDDLGVTLGVTIVAEDDWVPLEETRLGISGCYPRANDGGFCGPYGYDNPPEITCAASRGAAAVAGDIVRRLMPDYLDTLEGVLEAIYRHEKHERDVRRIQGALLAADQEARVTGLDHTVSVPSTGPFYTGWKATPGVEYVQNMKFEGLPVELAVRLVETYRQYQEESGS